MRCVNAMRLTTVIFSGESEPLRLENMVFWKENPAATET